MTTLQIREFTREEKERISCDLRKQLGPEFLKRRAGPGGGKVAYIEGRTAMNIANDMFGFDGWSSEIRNIIVDFMEEFENARVNVGVSVIVRITLKDGTYREDIGYGSMENGRGKAASLEKAKKEATTDAMKRALRQFGNVLGNCIYDKSYITQINDVKAPTIPFDVKNLYRDRSLRPAEQQLPPTPASEPTNPVPTSSKANEPRPSEVHQPQPLPVPSKSTQKGKVTDRRRQPTQTSSSKKLPKLSAPADITAVPEAHAVNSNNTDSSEDGFTQYGDDSIFQQLVENEDFDKVDSQIFYEEDDPSLHDTSETRSRKRSAMDSGSSSKSPKRRLHA